MTSVFHTPRVQHPTVRTSAPFSSTFQWLTPVTIEWPCVPDLMWVDLEVREVRVSHTGKMTRDIIKSDSLYRLVLCQLDMS